MNNALAPQPSFRVFTVLHGVVELYRRHGVRLLVLGLLASALTIISASPWGSEWMNHRSFASIFFSGILTSLPAYLAHAFALVFAVRWIRQESDSWSEAVAVLKGRIAKYFVAVLLLKLLTSLGYTLLLTPGILCAIFFFFVDILVLLENTSITRSFKASIRLVQGYAWKILGVYTLIHLPMLLIIILYYIGAARGITPPYLALMYGALSVLIFPIAPLFTAQAFLTLKQIREQDIAVEDYPGKRGRDLMETVAFAVLLLSLFGGWALFWSKFLPAKGVCPLSSRPKLSRTITYQTPQPQLLANQDEPQIFEEDAFTIYVPSGIDPQQNHPLLIGLTPNADAQAILTAFTQAAEEQKWIVYASKEYKNHIPMITQSREVMRHLDWVLTHFPVDESRIVVGGFSGGGMGSHAFSVFYPDTVSAVIVNTGMMAKSYLTDDARRDYPRGKLAVFLASPTDFRYQEMQRDRKYLEDLKWQTAWIEFDGGHRYAPPSYWNTAARWIENQWGSQINGVVQDEMLVEKAPKPDGPHETFSPDGHLLESMFYQDGQRNGPYRSYYEDGQLWSEGSYLNGQKHGTFRVYDPNGTRQTVAEYNHGMLNGSYQKYDASGHLEVEEIYRNAKRILHKEFNTAGVLLLETPYQDDQIHGVVRKYTLAGQIQLEMQYKNGVRNGESIQYDKNGEPLVTSVYQDGKLKNFWQVFWQQLSRRVR